MLKTVTTKYEFTIDEIRVLIARELDMFEGRLEIRVNLKAPEFTGLNYTEAPLITGVTVIVKD